MSEQSAPTPPQAAGTVRRCVVCKGAGGGQVGSAPDGSDVDWIQCTACDGVTGWQIQRPDQSWVGLLDELGDAQDELALHEERQRQRGKQLDAVDVHTTSAPSGDAAASAGDSLWREQYDADGQLDELFAREATVHVERMSDHALWMRIESKVIHVTSRGKLTITAEND